jgi:hypothetical protein
VDVLFRSAGVLLAWTAGLSLFLLINGGYVYKTTCPLPSGGKQSSWTWTINDILPYIRQTEEPCTSHTATRLFVSAVGIAPLDSEQDQAALDTSKVTAGDALGADSLRDATAAINAEFDRERAAASRLKDGFETTSGKREVAAFIVTTVTEYRRIKTRLDRPVNTTDPLLVDGRRLLSRWLSLQNEALVGLLSATSQADVKRTTNSAYAKLEPVAAELRSLSSSISAKYPEVSAWDFLFNTG